MPDRFVKLILLLGCLLLISPLSAQDPVTQNPYSYKSDDPNGIGKWYQGREIARVMSYLGIRWLERSSRQEEENTQKLINNMDLQADDVVADIGAGSGYHVFRMAPRVPEGTVYAVDIQDEMLVALRRKKKELGVENVEVVKGSDQDINIPASTLDKVLMVDVYHELEFPVEMMASVKKALKKNGEVFLIEYRGEDQSVPIKKLHKMTEKQAVREMKAAGFKLKENIGNLPWQHCMIFVKG